ncbi:hypothetical protein, partial [Streptomyces sp. MJM1172]|uniref:hypothetical protein n=1 Tax=Streptomyces sp. MJM1172 TaxID=1703926 RepID=UPI003FD45802
MPGRAASGRQRAESTYGADDAGPEAEVRGEGAPPRPVRDGVAAPVGRAEGRWLRGGRRTGGARYAGAAVPQAPAF